MSNSLVLFFTKVNTKDDLTADVGLKITNFLDSIKRNKNKTLKDILLEKKAVFFLEDRKKNVQLESELGENILCRLALLWDCDPNEYNDGLKAQLNNLLSQADEVFLAVHVDSVEEKKKQKEYVKEKLNNFKKEIAWTGEYKHVTGDSIYGALSDLLGCLQQNNFSEYDKYLKNLLEQIKKNIIKPFSLLKHHIAHLFLPVDIDLQGIAEVKGQKTPDGRDAQENYLENVLKDDEQWYRRKLADLQFIVGKIDAGKDKPGLRCDKSPPEGDFVKPTVKETDLSDGKPLLQLIKDKKTEIEEEWNTLLELSGLELKEGETDLFGLKCLEPKLNSPIFQFMCILDCRIHKKKYDEVSEISNFFNDKRRKIKVKNKGEVAINDFHTWFCLLDETLDNLRNTLSKESRCPT